MTPEYRAGLARDSAVWIAPFLPALQAAGTRVLELGCGPGADAAFLLTHGFRVTATDLSRVEIAQAREAAPAARFFVADLRAPLSARDGVVDAVLASLSLHYFAWETTLRAAREVRRVVRPGGAFLLRVNATDDTNFGAGEGVEVAPGLFRVANPRHPERELKRFFDEAAVRAMLADVWRIDHLAHRTISRYGMAKQVWECLAQ